MVDVGAFVDRLKTELGLVTRRRERACGTATGTRDGVEVELTPKEWALLRVMAMRPDRVHPRDALNDALYGFDDESSSNTLEVFISGLRRKLGRDSIQTLRGLGYRLTGDAP